MNDYETLLEKVKGLNRELALSYISAFGQMQEADGGDFRFHDGRCDALTDAKQLVEKIIEESPGNTFASRTLKHIIEWLIDKNKAAFDDMEGADGDDFNQASVVHAFSARVLEEIHRQFPSRPGGAVVFGSGQ